MSQFKLTFNRAAASPPNDLPLEIAQWIRTHITNSMGEEKHGREYQHGNVVHVASAPGESPARDTDTLNESFQIVPVSNSIAIIGTNVESALPLEFGSVHIAPRPFMAPAFEAAGPVLHAALKKVVA